MGRFVTDPPARSYAYPKGLGAPLTLCEGAAGVFGKDKSEAAASSVDLKSLHAKIGELTLESDFLEGALTKAGLLSAKR